MSRKFILMYISKEKRFIATSIILSLGFLGINMVNDPSRLLSILGLAIVTLIAFIISLWEGLGINPTLMSLILPPLYTLGVGIFWFLVPVNVLARLPVVILYGIGIYAMCRTENVFTVSSFRTIPLFRGVRWIGFVLTFFTAFLLYNAVISIKANIIVTGICVFLISFFIFLQGLWVSLIERKDLVLQRMFIYAATFALILMQISILLYFWPVTIVGGSIFLTVVVYVLLGLGQAELEGRLFKQTIQEHLLVGVIVFIVVFLATHWG